MDFLVLIIAGVIGSVIVGRQLLKIVRGGSGCDHCSSETCPVKRRGDIAPSSEVIREGKGVRRNCPSL